MLDVTNILTTPEAIESAKQRDEEYEKRNEERKAYIQKNKEEGNKAIAEYWKNLKDKKEQEQEQEPSIMDINSFISKLKQNNTQPRFTLAKYEKLIPEYLTIAYKNRVELRGIEPIMDEYTTTTISDMSRWLVKRPKVGIMLRGYVGVGKTTLLYAVQDLLTSVYKMMKVTSALEITELAKNDEAAFKRLQTYPFLGIDDLGVEPQSIKNWGNESNPLIELLSSRYDHQLFTIITTNLIVNNGIDDIQTHYGERIADRLREMCNTICYDSKQKSYRK